MAENSKIEWTQATWNPLAGCEEVSPGCTNCYAAVMAKRLEAMGQEKYKGTTRTLANGKVVWTGKITLDEEALSIPLKRKKPTAYFVNSMSDLFHDDVADEFIDKVFAVMALCPQHTFQVLTKRAKRLPEYLKHGRQGRVNDAAALSFDRPIWWSVDGKPSGATPWPLPNVWLGVSVEDQQRADERIPHLLKTPAAVRFLSCEPLLSAVDLYSRRWLYETDGLGACHCCQMPVRCRHEPGFHKVDWVIVGGESGPGARPMQIEWARSLVKQCEAAAVPVFLKQLGSVPIMPQPQGATVKEKIAADLDACSEWPEGTRFGNRTGLPAFNGLQVLLADKKGGEMEEWSLDLRVRQMPSVPAAIGGEG